MKLYVYKNQYGFSIMVKGKTKDGEELKEYIPVYFVKCTEPTEDKNTVIVKDGYLGLYKNKNGEVKVKFNITSYNDEEFGTQEIKSNDDDLIEISDEFKLD